MDRNDKLLLALGWRRRLESMPSLPPPQLTHVWQRPDNTIHRRSRPRPFDNLQDAVDCVPEGWDYVIVRRNGKCAALIGPGTIGKDEWEDGQWSDANTPAEALSDSISEAMEAGQ